MATGAFCDAEALAMFAVDGFYLVKRVYCITPKKKQYHAGNKNEWKVFFKGVKTGSPQEEYLKSIERKKSTLTEIIQNLNVFNNA